MGDNTGPDAFLIELLRSCLDPAFEDLRGLFEPESNLLDLGVGAKDCQRWLALMCADLSGMHQVFRSGRDGLSGDLIIDELSVDAPQVVNECDQIGHQFTTG